MEPRKIKPDSKGRINLGDLAAGVSSFNLSRDGDKIILEPFCEIPSREKWLFDNKLALDSLKKGLTQAKAGKLSSR